MKCLIYQFKKSKDVDYDISFMNREYANKFNYDYKIITEGYQNIAESWQKVFLANDFIDNYDIIFYIDFYAFIHDKEKDLTHYLNNKSLAFPLGFSGKIIDNAFIIKNDTIGKHIIKLWCDIYGNDHIVSTVHDIVYPYIEHINTISYSNSVLNNKNVFIIDIGTIDNNILLCNLVNYLIKNDKSNRIHKIIYNAFNKRAKIDLYNKIYNILPDKKILTS